MSYFAVGSSFHSALGLFTRIQVGVLENTRGGTLFDDHWLNSPGSQETRSFDCLFMVEWTTTRHFGPSVRRKENHHAHP